MEGGKERRGEGVRVGERRRLRGRKLGVAGGRGRGGRQEGGTNTMRIFHCDWLRTQTLTV